MSVQGFGQLTWTLLTKKSHFSNMLKNTNIRESKKLQIIKYLVLTKELTKESCRTTTGVLVTVHICLFNLSVVLINFDIF